MYIYLSISIYDIETSPYYIYSCEHHTSGSFVFVCGACSVLVCSTAAAAPPRCRAVAPSHPDPASHIAHSGSPWVPTAVFERPSTLIAAFGRPPRSRARALLA